ncbi:uncharacterized protein LOC141829895 [Curcuma longa]|uniref:uncharacterized protein LOC141829895 n=1 Tax=Curcuma longa TaxID=136217 RepID=UPI003D9DDC91
MEPQQKKFLLVAVDYFSKWVEAEALARITEGAVMKFLWGNIICRYGIPYRLVSDNANGQAEVINREIIKGLEKKLDHEGGSWVDELPSVLVVIPYHSSGKYRYDAFSLGLWWRSSGPYRSRGPKGHLPHIPSRRLVWKRAKPVGDVDKLEPPWEGPYQITKKTSTGSYYLADAADKELKRPWNALYLRPYRT